MYLELQVKNFLLEKKEASDHDIQYYYLICLDEDYEGEPHFDISSDKPFKNNWYTWSESTYLG